MKVRHNLVRGAVALGAASALVVGGSLAASAHTDDNSKKTSTGTLKAHVYIDDWAGGDNCGSFNTNASSTAKVSSISNVTDFDPQGIGASAEVKGVSVSVSGNNGASPAMTNTNKNAYSAPISGTACASWSTVYLGVYATAQTKINGTLYSVSAHV